jgi:hypothetical protein
MAIVGVFALEFAAMRSGSRLAFSAVYTLTALGLLFAVVAAKYGGRDTRAFWFGFAVFGWGYLLLALGPWSNPPGHDAAEDDRYNTDLLTTGWIDSSLDLVRGNAPEAVNLSAVDRIEQFAEYTTGVAHLMVTLALAVLGGYVSLALKRRRSPRRSNAGHAGSRSAILFFTLLTLPVLGSLADQVTRPTGPYFPGLPLARESRLGRSRTAWYSRHLRAMREPSLWKLSKADPGASVYRLLWLPSFHHSACFRLVRSAGTSTLRVVVVDGYGGYDPGQVAIDKTVTLSPARVAEFDRLLGRLEFWSLSTEPKIGGAMEDGAQLILEGTDHGRYHVIDRQVPDPDYLRLCRYVFNLAQIPSLVETLTHYHHEDSTN